MCGLCGIWYFGNDKLVDPEVLRAMTTQLIHRGPDEEGFYYNGSIGLGFRRLNIIDAADSHQPLSSEDGQIQIVCNGEIYNYAALRAQLSNRHAFRTHGDIEPILHLYEDCSSDCVLHLRGMFAFAIWDNRLIQLTLAVDRFGKKPLYYLIDDQKIIFASEIKALLQHHGISRALDYEALDEYLSCGYISAPHTIFAAIHKLPPGHILTLGKNGQAQIKPYWSPQFAGANEWDSRSFADLSAELSRLLVDAVRLRMVGDVPIGAFLSGGVDSSSVIAFISQLSPTPIRTFSVAFEESGYDESRYAQTVADYWHTDHHVVTVRPADALAALPQLIRQFDEPFADSSMIPTYLLAQFAHKQVTVALSGDGGDEIFAGYVQHLYGYRQQFLASIIPTSLHPAAAQFARALPHKVKLKPYLAAIDQPPQYWNKSGGFFLPQQRHQLYTNEFRHVFNADQAEQTRIEACEHIRHLDGLSQLQYHDLTIYLPGDILVKVDRAAMLTSLEVRCPLLDHHIFEFMARIPPRYRVSLKSGKLLLRKALGAMLPPVIHQRAKQGFSIPQADWLRGAFNPLLRDTLATLHRQDLFNQTVVQRLLDEHSSGQSDHKDRLWALLCFDLWSREYRV